VALARAIPDGFEASAAVQRWRRALLGWVGVPVAEVDGRVETLATFCTVTGTSPDAVLAAARYDLPPVLAAAEEQEARLVVQSFLIHNGLNVFGAVVCMPRTTVQLAEQGDRWARHPSVSLPATTSLGPAALDGVNEGRRAVAFRP
jgi:hypothetical protein